MRPQGTTSPSPRPPRRTSRVRLGLGAVLAGLVLLAGAGPAGAVSTDAAYVISGHGWGHGIGMSQWGAYGYAKNGWAYRAILKHYYTGIGFVTQPNAAKMTIRVRLRSGLKSVGVSCPYDYTATDLPVTKTLAIPAGTTATTTYVNGAYHVVAGTKTQNFATPPFFTPSKGALRTLTATDLGVTGAYRGVFRVLYTGGGLMLINKLPLESYLRGVVPREVSPSWPVEALKAQACAARAYAYNSRKPIANNWDVYTDARSQVYMGVGVEDPRSDAAVAATAGVTPTSGGKVITAYYFSCSGGHTESIEYGWPGAAAVPYLKGVSDPYDSFGSLHDWGPLKRTSAQLSSSLGLKGTLRAIVPVKRGTSPRVVKAALVSTSGITFMDGNMLRMKLGLNSTWASFTSMSIQPAARDKTTITKGATVPLSGRIYPALAAGASVQLRWYVAGVWHSRNVVTTRVTQALGSHLGVAYKTVYSAYTVTAKPGATTTYYFLRGTAASPKTTVTVK